MVFEGIGALSAGASSRLLIDYPEPHRSAILDLLFKPNYGASLHHLKVEIGGDANSTDGTEPSHARTRAEFEKPRPEYYDRGYEWWLMTEAKKRNPRITFESLQWAAPGWIGRGNFWSQDNADFIATFIRGARTYHNLIIGYQGIWNESASYDVAWIKTLRKTLDREGLGEIKVVAADMVGDTWRIVGDLQKDPELKRAVYAVSTHYPGANSPESAKKLGLPLWAGEDGPWKGTWEGARVLAKTYNRNYVQGRMVHTTIWSPITCYYDNLPLPGSGLMRANTPWSGHYEVQPAIWATAHTTQFAYSGWKYLDSGCGLLDKVGSYVTLKSPDSGDYSIIIESMDAASKPGVTTLQFKLGGSLSASPLHIWRTTEAEPFVRLPDIQPVERAFAIRLDGQCIYSLTTTTGQRKGWPAQPIPAAAPFPLPYSDDFESKAVDKLPRYFSDQAGSFAVVERSPAGKCLQQLIPQKCLGWGGHIECPYTILGDPEWKDYVVAADVRPAASGFASICGRVNGVDKIVPGYWLKIDSANRWELKAAAEVLSSGSVTASVDGWHKLELRLARSTVTGLIDGVQVASTGDCRYVKGLAGLASEWSTAQFDNFTVQPHTGPLPPEDHACINLASGKLIRASSEWSKEYTASMANDGNLSTRWNSQDGKSAGEWLEIDFGQPTLLDRTVLREAQNRITGYKIQYWTGTQWLDACVGQRLGERKTDNFTPVKGSKVRLLVTSTENGQTPTISEFEIYRARQ